MLLMVLLALVTCSRSRETGNISGRLVFGPLGEEKPQEVTQDVLRVSVQNVMIVLCEVDEGLPEGPVISDMNEEKSERIGIIRGNQRAITDSTGNFMLKDVPVGTYLVLFHLSPDFGKTLSENWGDGIVVTEADWDQSSQRVTPSSNEFWIEGGILQGTGDWSSQDGFILNEGIVGSTYLGFFFLVHNQRPYHIVNVQPDSTTEILLTTPILL